MSIRSTYWPRPARAACSISRPPHSPSASRGFVKPCSGARLPSTGIPVLYVNQVGGNDDLVFDGRSCAFDSAENLIARARRLKRTWWLSIFAAIPGEIVPPDNTLPEEEVWQALVLGTRDYVRKLRLRARLAGLVRRHRFVSDSGDRCGGARPGKSAGRADALNPLPAATV